MELLTGNMPITAAAPTPRPQKPVSGCWFLVRVGLPAFPWQQAHQLLVTAFCFCHSLVV